VEEKAFLRKKYRFIIIILGTKGCSELGQKGRLFFFFFFFFPEKYFFVCVQTFFCREGNQKRKKPPHMGELDFNLAGEMEGLQWQERGSAPHAAGEQPHSQLRPSPALTEVGLRLPLPWGLPKAEPGQGGFASPLEVAEMWVSPRSCALCDSM